VCKSCEAPGDHSTTGDCRAAQRKEIRRLRAENDSLKAKMREYEKLYDEAREAYRKSRSSSMTTSTIPARRCKCTAGSQVGKPARCHNQTRHHSGYCAQCRYRCCDLQRHNIDHSTEDHPVEYDKSKLGSD
jgi:hypothetical protein